MTLAERFERPSTRTEVRTALIATLAFTAFSMLPWAGRWVFGTVLDGGFRTFAILSGLWFLRPTSGREPNVLNLIAEISVALCFGLVLFAGDFHFLSSGNSDSTVLHIALVALLIFMVQLVSRTADLAGQIDGRLEALGGLEAIKTEMTQTSRRLAKLKLRLAAQVTSLEKTTQTASTAMEHGRYAAVAAEILGLQRLAFRDNSDAFRNALYAAPTAIKAWVLAGRKIITSSRGTRSAAANAADAWWRTMEIYHREEVFDISRFELATNVRNYCNVLVGVIEEYKKQCAKDGTILFVASVSPFSPKDFYNYPNGRASSRYYHEPEFFGTYRRLMRTLMGCEDTRPFRLVLAAPNPRDDFVSSSKSTAGLGWPLDAIDKMILDCAHLRVLPLPLTLSRAPGGGGEDLDRGLDRFSSIKLQLFPDESDPRKLLPGSVRRALWNPMLVDFPADAVLANLYAKSKVRSSWLTRAFAFETNSKEQDLARVTSALQDHRDAGNMTRYESFETDLVSHGDVIFGNTQASLPSVHLKETWTRLNRRLLGSSPRESDLIELDRYLGGSIEDIPAALLEKLVTHLATLTVPDDERTEVLKELVEAVRCARQTEADLEKRPTRKRRHDLILEAVTTAQRIDAADHILLTPPDKDAYVCASTGLDLGLGEDWLHRLLIREEAKDQENVVKEYGGPLRVFDAFVADFCGIPFDGNASRTIANERLRFVSLAVDAKADTTDVLSVRYVVEHDLLPEFMLIGSGSPDAKNPSDVEWRALIGATINEPFHTCRVILRFADQSGSHGRDLGQFLTRHVNWLNDIWAKSEATSKKVSETIGHLIQTAENPAAV